MRSGPCSRCGATVWSRWPLGTLAKWITCTDQSACAFRVHVQSTEPPEPIEYESEPEDAWICSQCRGVGEYPTAQDFETGAIRMEQCDRCLRTRFRVENIGLWMHQTPYLVSDGVEPGYREPAS